MKPDQASFERHERHGHSTLVITGEIDIANAPTFLDELMAAAAEAHSPAVVDMSAVTFLDSSGLNALVNARRRLEDTDVSLVLLNPSPPCQRVLEITGIDEIFEVVTCSPRN
jgi:anti-sigma B factor antagonist